MVMCTVCTSFLARVVEDTSFLARVLKDMRGKCRATYYAML